MKTDEIIKLFKTFAAELSKSKSGHVDALAQAIAECGGSLEGLRHFAETPARLKAWRRVVDSLIVLAETMNAAKCVRVELAAISEALTRAPTMRTQHVGAVNDPPTKRAGDAQASRSSSVSESLIMEDRLRLVAEELSSRELTADRHEVLIGELSRGGKAGFTSEDRKRVAQAVTGRRYRNGKQALEDLASFTWSRIQARASNASWGETAATRL